VPGKYIVTGGAGFIGSHLVEQLLSEGSEVIIVDKLTYASTQWQMPENRYITLLTCDISNRESITRALRNALKAKDPTEFSIYHLAAESHVDRSIESADVFITTNVLGTQIMLDLCRDFKMRRFVHISTDEVYGSLTEGEAGEDSPLNPTSAYSASKAASDLIALAHHKTFGTDVVVTRCVNNFGPRQSLEKLIPRVLSRLLSDQEIPIYGDGSNVREWVYVQDHCQYLRFLMANGKRGHIYNLGSNNRKTNLELVNELSKLANKNPKITFTKDRLGHDQRYALNSTKVMSESQPINLTPFDEALKATVSYYTNYSGSQNYLKELAKTEAFYGN